MVKNYIQSSFNHVVRIWGAMEQLSHDYLSQTESRRDELEPRRGGALESASKRVRMIFSVMASPNRIDILRILNSKGQLTYSELKAFAGFIPEGLHFSLTEQPGIYYFLLCSSLQ